MELIKDLGFDKIKKASFGVYKCPKCNNEFATRKGDVTQGKVTQCRSCSEKPKCTQEHFSMRLVETFSKPSEDGTRKYTFVKLECPICLQTKSYQAAGAKRNQYTECPECRVQKLFTGTKACTKCKKEKPIEEFTSTKATSSGKYSKCKECRSNDAKEHRKLMTKEERYAISAASSYGITKEEAILLRRQGTSCGICTKPLTWEQRHLDHCHKSLKVRGILCPTCNKGLGSFYDSIENLENAITWLKENNA